MRPAYRAVTIHNHYVPMQEREAHMEPAGVEKRPFVGVDAHINPNEGLYAKKRIRRTYGCASFTCMAY